MPLERLWVVGGLLGARGQFGQRLGATVGVLEEQEEPQELIFCMLGQFQAADDLVLIRPRGVLPP